MYIYRRSFFKSRLVLAILLVACVIFLTVHYKENSEGFLHRIQKYSLSIAAPFQIGLSKISRPFKSAWRWGRSIAEAGSRYQEIKEQVEQLQQETVNFREIKAENERLKRLLDLKESMVLSTRAANVISKSADNYRCLIEIDRGSNDGVKEEMPVICPDGVIGTVVASGPNAAEVKLIIDQKAGIAAMIQESRACGIALGTGEDILELNFVKQNAKVRKGDLVVTSGMGGIFPKGLLIGVVSYAPMGIKSDLYREIKVTPAASFDSLEDVLVITKPVLKSSLQDVQ